jgi:Na+-driven multidrug efflux pump
LTLLLLLIFSVAAGSTAPVSQSLGNRESDESSSNTIKGSGCVTAGVEANCLMVTDSKTGTVYNVYFRGSKKPKVGTAIRFTGTPHDGPTICMQGRAVNVRSWRPLKMKCGAQTAGESGC